MDATLENFQESKPTHGVFFNNSEAILFLSRFILKYYNGPTVKFDCMRNFDIHISVQGESEKDNPPIISQPQI